MSTKTPGTDLPKTEGKASDKIATRTYIAVWIANFLAAAGMMAFLPFFPSYLRTLGVPEADLGLWAGICVGAAPLGAALMGPIWGALGDRFGRKPMVLRALFGLVIFVGLMCFATTPWQLLALRLGQGAFSGFLPPSVTLVTMSFPPGQSGRISGGLQAAMASGSIVGPLFGSFFRELYEPRFLFLGTAGLCAIGGLLVLFFAHESSPEASGKRAQTPAQTGPPPARLKSPIGPTVMGSAIRFGVAAKQGTIGMFADIGQRLVSMIRKPRLGLALGFLFLTQFGIGATNPQLELFVGQLHPDWDTAEISRHTAWLFSVMAIMGVFAMPYWGRVGDQKGHGRVLLIAAAMAGVSLIVSGLAAAFWTLFAGRVLLGAFGSGMGPAAFGIVADVTPREEQGAANGAVFSARAMALAISSMLGGAMAGVVGLRALFLIGGFGLIGLALLARRRIMA